MESIRLDSINSVEMFILILVILLIFFIWFLEPRMGKKKLKNRNEHGSSKFADLKEIQQTFVRESIAYWINWKW